MFDPLCVSQSILVCLEENVRQSVTMTTPAHACRDEEEVTVKVR